MIPDLQIPVEEFFEAIFPTSSDPSKRVLALMVSLYLDESYDEKCEKACAVAGFIGNTLDWIRTVDRWEDCLHRYNLRYFKASECESLIGEFAQFRDDPSGDLQARFSNREKEMQIEIKTAFVDIAVTSDIVGFGAALLLKDYEELCSDDPAAAPLLEDPYFVCAQAVMGAAGHVNTVINQQKSTNHILSFVLDNRDKEFEHRFLRTYEEFQEKNEYAAQYMGSCTFASELNDKPLQTADLLVYEARKLLQNSVYDPQRSVRATLKRIAPNVQSLYRFDRRSLEILVEGNVTNKPVAQIIEEKFGPDQKIEMFFDLSME